MDILDLNSECDVQRDMCDSMNGLYCDPKTNSCK